jgi:hypothetical protein
MMQINIIEENKKMNDVHLCGLWFCCFALLLRVSTWLLNSFSSQSMCPMTCITGYYEHACMFSNTNPNLFSFQSSYARPIG